MTLTLAKSLNELPEYTGVLANLVARDLKVKYQTKALGFVWSLLYPGIMIAIWYMVFKSIIRIAMPHYWAFLICGMLPYQFVQSAVGEGAGAVRRNAGLIRKIYLPMEVLVIAGVTVKLIEFLIQMTIAVLLLMLLHHNDEHVHFAFWKTMIVVPPAIGLFYLFVLGVSLPLAAWSVIYRDLEHMITLALMALFYLTPIFWSLTFIDRSPWKFLFALNPVMSFIELLRAPLYWGQWPTNPALGGGAIVAWFLACVFAAGAFVLGYTLFDKSKHVLAEVV